ncbi:MAG: twin-arginine translocase subunit TatC [Bacteroidales bacterium]|jgi:sec-independent protein translocase protein TatC|nr:twin-arginine translocase subunit TatC [Bacteroidales bacterium]
MTFWDHLDELRKTLIEVVVVLALFTVIIFLLKEPVFDVILAPNSTDFITYRLAEMFLFADLQSGGTPFVSVPLINTELTSQFLIHIKVSFYVALVLTSPFIFYKLYQFVSPALYRKEKKYSTWVLVGSCLSFFAGLLISYFVIFPFSFRFLANYQVSGEVSNMISLHSYIGTLISLCLLMGLFFELPVMSWLLCKLGIIRAAMLKKYRRHAVSIILIVAAIITPTTDIFTLILVALPIVLLYELSIVIVRITQRNRKIIPFKYLNFIPK